MHGHLTVVRYLLQQELSTERLLGDRKVLLCSYITVGFSDMFNRRVHKFVERQKFCLALSPDFAPHDSRWRLVDRIGKTEGLLHCSFIQSVSCNSTEDYLTIIPGVRVGYEIVDSQRGAKHRVGYNHLISNKREWNNCFIKNDQKIPIHVVALFSEKKKKENNNNNNNNPVVMYK